MKEIKKNFDYIFGEFLKFSKKGNIALLVNAIFEPFPTFLIALLSKNILDLFKRGAGLRFITRYLLYFTILLFAINLVVNFSYNIFWPIVVKFRFSKLTHLGELAMKMDYSLLENYSVMEEFEIAKSSSSDNQKGFAGYVLNSNKILKGIVGFFLNGAVLLYYLPFLIAPAIFVFVFSLKKSVKNSLFIHEKENYIIKECDRKENYFNDAIWDFSTGKEIRIFSMESILVRKLNCIFKEINLNVKDILTKENKLFFSNGLIWFIFEIATYLYIFILHINGKLSINSIVMLIMLISLFRQAMIQMIHDFSNLYKNSIEVSDYLSFFNKYSEKEGKGCNISNIKIKDIDEIEFKDVWFRYSDRSPFVLKGINFKLSNKEKFAIVGVNGSGKSTIIKLLLGLYKTSKGQILINGFDINNIEKKSLYFALSAMFQKTIIYSFTVAQNVAMASEFNRERVILSLKRADIYNVISGFDENVDKMMLKLIDDNGYVPSGGQSQKINFARTLYRGSPLFILDEPSAFLDPFSEERMLRTIVENSIDKITIYISHRLTTVKFCDKVILLENGKIKEQGNFDEIMEKQGEFYNMYMSQKMLYLKD